MSAPPRRRYPTFEERTRQINAETEKLNKKVGATGTPVNTARRTAPDPTRTQPPARTAPAPTRTPPLPISGRARERRYEETLQEATGEKRRAMAEGGYVGKKGAKCAKCGKAAGSCAMCRKRK